MENIYVFRVYIDIADPPYVRRRLLREDIVRLTCVQDIEKYQRFLEDLFCYEEEALEVEVKKIEELLELDYKVQERLLSV